jgi:hypothetical protein
MQGLEHFSFIQALLVGQSLSIVHSGLQFGGPAKQLIVIKIKPIYNKFQELEILLPMYDSLHEHAAWSFITLQ